MNYFLGSDPSVWRRNIPTFREVQCRGVWPGTTVVCHGSCDGKLEIDFIVEPDGDPNTAFVSDILAGQPTLTPVAAARTVHAWTTAVLRSAQSGQWEPV